MIQHQIQPLSSEQVRQLEEWLRDPARRLYQEHLASRSALHLAEAGNKLLEFDPIADPEQQQAIIHEAQAEAEMARKFEDANKIMDTVMQDDYKFETVQLHAGIRPIDE